MAKGSLRAAAMGAVGAEAVATLLFHSAQPLPAPESEVGCAQQEQDDRALFGLRRRRPERVSSPRAII